MILISDIFKKFSKLLLNFRLVIFRRHTALQKKSRSGGKAPKFLDVSGVNSIVQLFKFTRRERERERNVQ